MYILSCECKGKLHFARECKCFNRKATVACKAQCPGLTPTPTPTQTKKRARATTPRVTKIRSLTFQPLRDWSVFSGVLSAYGLYQRLSVCLFTVPDVPHIPTLIHRSETLGYGNNCTCESISHYGNTSVLLKLIKDRHTNQSFEQILLCGDENKQIHIKKMNAE